ncbi:MAG: cytochrome C oxidase subunit IV family protein [Planctomycetota bacterium]
MSTPHASPSYKTYWLVWFVLLVITVAMVFTGAWPVLIGGMLVKASLISLLYMHLIHEKKNLIWTVLLGIFLTSAFLVGLMIPDGRAM